MALELSVEEYIKSVNYSNINKNNIANYIRKYDTYGCVIDAMVLVCDSTPNRCSSLLDKLIQKNRFDFITVDFDGEIEKMMKIDELIRLLCLIPGRQNRVRLYKYSEAIISFLNGDYFDLLQMITTVKLSEDDDLKIVLLAKRVNSSYFARHLK